MTRPHEELRDALGAYVLGQLDDTALLADVEEHLSTCDTCRDEVAGLGPLVALLGGVDPDAVRPVGVVPPRELDERIRLAIPADPAAAGPVPVGPARTAARRRWTASAAAAAAVVGVAAAASVVTAVVVHDDEPSGPTVIAVPQVQTARGITASAGLVDHTWGVEIKLQATGLQAGERFTMWVVGDDGTTHEAGQILGVAGTEVICDMSSSVLLRQAASFRVVDAGGTEVISAPMPS